MTPRQVVRDWIVAKLKTITLANGFKTQIVTVELRGRQARNVDESECPAIIIDLREDRPERPETQGDNQANNHFRAWSIDLMIVIRDQGVEPTFEDAGEVLLADVERCLINNRFNNSPGMANGKPSDVQFGIIPDEFTRVEATTMATLKLPIIVKYDFTLGDLQ